MVNGPQVHKHDTAPSNSYPGNACRVQPNEVVFNTPSAYRSIYGQKGNVRKADIYAIWRRNNMSSTLSEVDKSVHGQKKKLLTATFTDKAIRSAETFICQHVDRLCALLLVNEEKLESKDMSRLADYLIFDIMCDLSFGKSFDLKEPGPNPLKNITQSLDEYMSFLSNIGRSPFLSSWLWLRGRGLNAALEHLKPKNMQVLFTLIRENISRRFKEEMQNDEDSEAGRKDMFHYLFHNRDSETGIRVYSNEVLPTEASLLLTTALGGTATSLAAFFFYITRDNRVYQELVSEIRTRFSSADDIDSGMLLTSISCRYLRACIDETLRMTPSAPGENMRCVMSGGQEIDGDFVPEGVLVGTSSWSLFHSEEHFGDPWIFRPERWIVSEPAGVTAENVSSAQAAFFPFSIGTVSCVGQKLARSILSITIAKLLYTCDISAAPGAQLGEGNARLGWGRRSENVFQVRDATFALREGPLVQFARKPATLHCGFGGKEA